MSRVHCAAVSAVCLTALAVGCGQIGPISRPPPPPRPTPSDWKGEASIDPAGDLLKLRGRWDEIRAEDPYIGKVESWIEIDWDTITFRYRSKWTPDSRESYKFVVNSAASPKVLRCVAWLGPGEPASTRAAPRAMWYSIDSDSLTLWDEWADYGEKPRRVYQRAEK